MKRLLLFLIIVSLVSRVNATHNRAGEITYKQISQYEFEFTITTFTYTLSAADRDALEIQWGDNTYSVAPRVSKMELPDFYRRNIYVVRHTFPGPGTYEIVMQDPNRNYGVLNIPNSVNVIFSVKTTMVINPQLGTNNTPVLLNYPIDKAALHRKFIHNPAAFDIDGDSISYHLTTCTKENGKPIENYTFPPTDKPNTKIYVDSITGDLVWDAPKDTGIFNVAMNIEEWRNGVKINNIVRDMQIEVHNSRNNPPENPPLRDLCVLAGDSIHLELTSIDIDNDKVKQTAVGGPFAIKNSPASFTLLNSGPGFSTSVFRWQTTCDHVRKQPYTVVLKAEDNYPTLKLVDLDNFNIRIMAPGPKIVKAVPGNNTISVRWPKSPCPQAQGYIIYRSTNSVSNVTDSCAGGIRPGTGYERIAYVKGINDTSFVDNNSGAGLTSGLNYCYRIVALFPDGAMSYPSVEACSTLIPGLPSLMNASATIIDPANGEVYVSWVKPKHLDTIPALGPYEYIISRTDNLAGNNFSVIKTIQTTDLLDTFYVDKGINTVRYPWVYKVELFNNETGNRFPIGKSEVASTMYPELYPSDNQVTIRFTRNVPWINSSYTIYKLNPLTSVYDSIGFTTNEAYVDSGLANNQQVCYRVKSYGYRTLDATYKNSNWSHIACATPIDTIKPCPPALDVKSSCDSSTNVLIWKNKPGKCSEDIVSYKIYYKNQLNADLQPLTEVKNATDTSYTHLTPGSIAGCYAITAIDSFGNESEKSILVCVDNCTGYSIPNVFSPNGDNKNDYLKAYNPNGYVKKIDIKIFNRWGKMVFHTEDADINWDGRDMDTKQFVPSGVYYYLCDVYEPRLNGIQPRNITGFVHLYYGKGAKPFVE